MRMKNLFVAMTICLAGAALVMAQSVPPAPPVPLPTPSAQSAVHVTTRIVQVSVTVQDADGKPVKGLTKDDFVLMDEGKWQEITAITPNKITASRQHRQRHGRIYLQIDLRSPRRSLC